MAYPYIATSYHGGSQTKVNRIVIHATVSPCAQGGARNVARYFQSKGAGGSAHYVVDPGEIVQCVKEGTVAYHAPPNTGSIGIELCDPQKGPGSRWADANHKAMLYRAAALVREVADRWDVPLVRLTPAQLKAGKRGICGHVDVSDAFGKTDHGDPEIAGPFPWANFMHLVTKEDDMAAGDVWTYEIAAPWDDKDPKWQASTHLRVMQSHVRATEAKVDAQGADLAEVKAELTNMRGVLTQLVTLLTPKE